MPNIQDHAASIGCETTGSRPFDELDSLILTQIVYMPMEGFLDCGQSATIAGLWAFLRGEYPDGFEDPFQQKRYALTEVCAGLPRYRDWTVHSYVNRIDLEREMQFAACSFELPDEQTFIAFRGTDWSLVGWKEDLNMSFMTVPSQREAVLYARRVAAGNENALLLGGHSKGGNLSVFAGVWADADIRGRIRRVYSFDGPGVDEETMASPEYGLLNGRIESYLPQSSVIGMLLHYHPVYTVVRSRSHGILQHDAMNWQVENGSFVRLSGLDFSGRLTDEALHLWLKGMDMEARRFLVDTLYQVLEASQAETLDSLVKDWHESALRILEALRGLDAETRKNVRRMLASLFGAGAAGMVRSLLPGLVSRLEGRRDEEEDA